MPELSSSVDITECRSRRKENVPDDINTGDVLSDLLEQLDGLAICFDCDRYGPRPTMDAAHYPCPRYTCELEDSLILPAARFPWLLSSYLLVCCTLHSMSHYNPTYEKHGLARVQGIESVPQPFPPPQSGLKSPRQPPCRDWRHLVTFSPVPQEDSRFIGRGGRGNTPSKVMVARVSKPASPSGIRRLFTRRSQPGCACPQEA